MVPPCGRFEEHTRGKNRMTMVVGASQDVKSQLQGIEMCKGHDHLYPGDLWLWLGDLEPLWNPYCTIYGSTSECHCKLFPFDSSGQPIYDCPDRLSTTTTTTPLLSTCNQSLQWNQTYQDLLLSRLESTLPVSPKRVEIRFIHNFDFKIAPLIVLKQWLIGVPIVFQRLDGEAILVRCAAVGFFCVPSDFSVDSDWMY